MAMLEKHRSSIYRSLAPILGEEETEAFLSEFPMTTADELVTKKDLALTTAELRQEMAHLKSSLIVTLIGAMTAQTAILGLVFTLSN